MTRTLISLLAATALFGPAIAARAADMGGPYRSPAVVQPLGESSSGGWYLRGDVGYGVGREPPLWESSADYGPYNGSWNSTDQKDAFVGGVGIGYQFTDNLRADLTADWRSNASFHGSNSYYSTDEATNNSGTYGGRIGAWTFLANGYYDIGHFSGVTPYVGAGVGIARLSLSDGWSNTYYTGATTGVASGTLEDKAKWNFAWALHAGLTWDLTSNLKLDTGYSFKSLGRVKVQEICSPAETCPESFDYKHFASHDIHLGVRWMFDTPTPAAPAPIVAKF